MRKYLVPVLFTLFLFAPNAFCAEVTVAWDAVDGADGYRLYQSFDVGATWSQPADVGNVQEIPVTVVETGLVLFKIGAYNTQGESVNQWQGAWYNHEWRPLDAPIGLGIK